jgi:hypothetical protein
MISHITAFLDLSNKPFILRPKPEKDELLSSWMVRVALAHDTMPWSFYNMHFPEYKNIIFSRDLDVWAPHELVYKLSQKSGYEIEELYNLTLRSLIGTVLPNFNPSCMNKYFSYIKVRGRSNRLYGQKFCFECLKDDKTPYFRKEWRLKSVYVCKKHNLPLRDRCPKCGIPISFYKVTKLGIGFTQCWKCTSTLA